jgi:amino acid adenylation domain-containing protein
VCTEPTLRAWAQAHDIPEVDGTGDVRGFLAERPFDYLFSIVNHRVVTAEELALPQALAINYHDGPLPRYAGSYATSWALMAGEKSHGLTWHVMTSVVDGGAILKQRAVEISPGETALSLNAKCFEAAIAAFGELVDELATGRVQEREQSLLERTFIPRYERPPAQAVIRWDDGAQAIDALVRALDFGTYPNPLALAKVLVGDEMLTVRRASAVACASEAPAGTVRSIGERTITVASGSGDVVLEELSSLDGEPCSVVELVRRHGLHPGIRLEGLDPETRERISGTNRRICPHEPFWIEKLRRLEPIVLPSSGGGRADRLETILLQIPRARFEMILAAFTAFLARLTTTYRFDIGFQSVELGSDLEGLPGLWAPTVPLRVDLSPEATVAEHMRQLDRELELVRRHRTYARDMVQRYPALSAAKGTGARLSVTAVAGRSLEHLPRDLESDLILFVATDSSECAWIYDTGVFASAEAQSLAERFLGVLEQTLRAPKEKIRRLSLLSDEERHTLLIRLNDSGELTERACLHELYEAQARLTPDAVAVWHTSGELTYSELDRRSNQLARHLQTLGVGIETLVAVSLPRIPPMLVALLGVLKAGGAYVPLDPRYPGERIRFMLEDSGARVVIGDGGQVDLSRDGATIAEHDDTSLRSGAIPDNLAYVLYTSGSTGEPKGVAIEHRNAVALLRWARSVYPPAELAGVLASTSLCFDLSVFEIFGPLTTGGRVVLVDDALGLARLPRCAHVTLVNTVPSAIAELLRTDLGLPESVRTVNLAGESASAALVDSIYARAHVRKVYDLYGPTEATTYSTCALRQPGGPATIGRPITGTRAYVLDAHGELAPFGMPGELYLGGAGVARGYLNRKDLTRERFIPDPFVAERGGRLYRTGDLVQYLPDGNLRFVGRLDRQVKVRGYRIELGEIEAALKRHRGVRHVVVDATAAQRLVAYVVEEPGHALNTAELRRHLGESLPDFMVPSAFVPLAEIPMTLNGKVDRRSLPSPADGQLEVGAMHVSPQSELEREIATVWEQALERKPVGTRDNFFDLGGDSLTVLYVSQVLKERLGRTVSLVQMYSHPTIEALARALATGSAGDGAAELGSGRGRARRQAGELRRASRLTLRDTAS